MLNAALGWWQADPAAGYVLVCYAARQVWGGASSRPAASGRRPRAGVGGGRLVRLVLVDQRVGGVGDRVDVGVCPLGEAYVQAGKSPIHGRDDRGDAGLDEVAGPAKALDLHL